MTKKELCQKYASQLHDAFVAEYDEPMNGDDIAEAVAEFKNKLKELSGE